MQRDREHNWRWGFDKCDVATLLTIAEPAGALKCFDRVSARAITRELRQELGGDFDLDFENFGRDL